jgi:Family of unknown function (DUF5677)
MPASKPIEISGNDECPCGKGKRYQKCCSKRAVKWMRNPDGSYSKSIPISSEVREALSEAKQQFKSMFGRAPRRSDRLFPHTYIDSLADTRRVMLQMLRTANIRPELIYAYLKTGRVVTKSQNLTTVEFEEYSAAIDEFLELREQGTSIDDLINPETPESILSSALLNVLIICGYFVEEYINTYVLTGENSRYAELDLAVSFAFVNFVKSLRSVSILLENGISYDANYLVRSLYENYFRIKFVYLNPSKASQILGFDTAEPSDSSGKEKRLRKPPPFKNMAETIGELQLFESFYGELSEISHSQTATIKHLLNDEGCFDYLNINADFEMSTLLSAHEICMRTLDCVYEHCSCPKNFKVDLFTALKRSFGAFLIGWLYLSEVDNRQMHSLSFELIEQLAVRHPSLRTIKEAAKRK